MFVICGVEGITSGTPQVIVPQSSPQFPAWARFGMSRMRYIQSFIRCFGFSMSGLRFTGSRYPAGAMQAICVYNSSPFDAEKTPSLYAVNS